MMINPLMQTNIRMLSNSALSSTRVAFTDRVRIEVLRCPPAAIVQWRIPEAKLGLMWVRDRHGNARVLSGRHPTQILSTGGGNLWFFPEGFDTEGEFVGCSATDCIGLFVEPSFVPSMVKSELSEPIIGFSDRALGRTFNALASQLAEPDEPQPMYIEGWAIQVLAHVRRARRVARSRSPRTSGLAPWQLRRAKELLLADISDHLPLSEVAAACRISVSHFARAFRVSTGTPPHQWLILERVNRASNLVMRSKMPLAEIATMCGFADQSHFGRLFARANGMSPGTWRRDHLEFCNSQSGARQPDSHRIDGLR